MFGVQWFLNILSAWKAEKLFRLERDSLCEKEHLAFTGYFDKIYCVSKIKIIKGKSVEETENLYNAFRCSFDGCEGLGHLWSMEEPQCACSGDHVFIIIRYQVFDLRPGVLLSDYEAAYAVYLEAVENLRLFDSIQVRHKGLLD